MTRAIQRLSYTLLALLLSLPMTTFCQQLPLRYFSQKDGLGNLSVNAVAQDALGYVWAATENGLYRFDGNRFRQFGAAEGLPERSILALHVDETGRLWVGTQGGLFAFEKQRFVPVLFQRETIPVWYGQRFSDWRPNQLLVVNKERLLMLERAGPAEAWTAHPFFSEEQIHAHGELNVIHSIYRSRDGELWMGCGKSVCHFRDGKIDLLGSSAGLPSDDWGGILIDREGTLWARSVHRLMSLAASAKKFTDCSSATGDQVTEKNYLPLVLDRDGLLLASNDTGVVRRRSGGGWRLFGKKEGLHTDSGINAILADRDGDVWLGTGGHGLAQWVGYRNWENWTSGQSLPSNNVWSFLRTRDNSLLVGTGMGVASLEGDRVVRRPGGFDGASQEWGSMIQDGAGNIWSGTFSGTLIRQDAVTGISAKVAGLPAIIHLFIDRSGRLWIGTNRGLYTIAHPEHETVPVRVEELGTVLEGVTVDIFGVCQTRSGDLWFATTNRVALLSNGKWSAPPMLPDGHYHFNLLACDNDGGLWLGGEAPAGLWHASGDATGLHLTHVVQPLLDARMIVSMRLDSRGWLWMGTDSGIAVWNRRAWRFFNQASGMVWDDANQYALYEDSDASMWIGTSNGASHIMNPEHLPGEQHLNVVTKSVTHNGIALAPGKPLSIPWGSGSINFSFAVLSYQNRDALRFRYRLKDREQEWSGSDNSEIRYAALAPGEYVLQVIADNAALQSISNLTEIAFEITPPWWQTRLFYALCVIAAAGAAVAGHRFHLRSILQRQKRMEQLVHERTAELEASREQHRLLALKDGLTGAWNRVALADIIDKEIVRTRRENSTFMLVLLDLDHFKKINDTYGHLAGDAVLREVVRRFAADLRAYDTVGRYGGEEFILILPGLNKASGCNRIERLHRLIGETPIVIDGERQITVTCSFGAIVVDSASSEVQAELVARADQAMYRAKGAGRNRIEYG